MTKQYNRLLEIETSLLTRVEENDGLLITPDFLIYIFFAIDSVDLGEDTYDWQNKKHGIAMASYQKCHDDDEKPQKPHVMTRNHRSHTL